jgi:hypothetical protein
LKKEIEQPPLLGRWWLQLIAFIIVILALRCVSFGDLDRHADETFYFLVGQRMHEGLLPYVDVWDRKPLGLFLIYYLIAGISTSVWSYQIAACIAAAVTATIICKLVAQWADRQAGLFAGVAFLLILGPFEGATGQTPDFYSPLIAGAVLLLLADAGRHRQRQAGWRSWSAMALCGLAITIKQTTLFESAFLGLYFLASLLRAGMPWPKVGRVALTACVVGAAPTLAIGYFYFSIGHWTEFWHAMVTSNLAKAVEGQRLARAFAIVVKAAPVLILAGIGLFARAIDRPARGFVAAWICAALLGFVAVPNVYGHYLLPVLVPLSVAAGFAFARFKYRYAAIVGFALYSFFWSHTFDRAWTVENNRAMLEMARLIREHDHGGGLLVFDGPVYLYAVSGERFLSPLVFPQHLNHQIEVNVSHLDTRNEIDRIIAARPGVIVLSRYPRSYPVNRYSRGKVLAYAWENCRLVKIETVHWDKWRDVFAIFGDCHQDGA